MSASPIDPRETAEPIDGEGQAPGLDPELVRFHEKRLKGKDPLQRIESRIWLMEQGVIPEPEARKARRKPSAQDETYAPGIPTETIPFTPSRGKKPARVEHRNLAAEVALIAVILDRPDVFPELVDRFDPEEFAGDAHRICAAAILARHRKGQSIDLVTLGEDLSHDLVFLESGGLEFLANVQSTSVKRSRPAELLDAIHSNAVRRRVISTAREMERRANEADDGAEILTQAQALIESCHRDPNAQGWQRPLLNESDTPLEFPLAVLPDGHRGFIESASKVVYMPPEYLAVPCLAIAGAGLGRSVAIKIRESWIEYALLYALVVGKPGTSKTTAVVKLAPIPIARVLRELRAEHLERVAAWRMAKQAIQAERKGKSGSLPLADLDELKPRPRRILVEDVTRERLAEVLSENPRGTMMILDEASDWLEGMGQYKQGGGNDKQIHLKIWSFSPLTIDRKGQEDGVPIAVPIPFNAICAGIQPDYLPRLASNGIDDGFVDRFLVSYPAEVKQDWSLESIDPASINLWCRAFRGLWDRRNPMTFDDEPVIVPFSKKALERYGEWYSAECRSVETDDFPDYLKGPWSKLRVYAARLALILEQLHWAYGKQVTMRPSPVGMQALEGALQLVEYFKSHFIRVHAKIHGGKAAENKFAADILAWCQKAQRTKFRESDAADNFRRRLSANPKDLNVALGWLVSRRCIRKVPSPHRSVGRLPSPTYEVNPFLFSGTRAPITFNSEVQEGQ